MNLTQEQIDKFWAKVDIRGEDECWEWKGARDDDGYGRLAVNQKDYRAHRISFLIANRHLPAPQGLHSCDNPPCCNPKHIFEGTQKDNSIDMCMKSRGWMQKLTINQVLEIRNFVPSKRGDLIKLARKYGVSHTLISMIKSRKVWEMLA